MSDEPMNHGHGNHGVEFEREDLSTRGIFAFMIGLAIIGVVIYFIINGMYSYLDKDLQSKSVASSPLVKPEESAAISSRRVTRDYVEKRFKENGAPLLEIDERTQLGDFLMNQEKQLNSYDWVDEKAGVARIPIDRAMELVAQRGLPVKPQGGVEGGSAVKPAATKPPAKAK